MADKDKKTERTNKMATSNFHHMADFPLIVTTDSFVKVCPDCGITNGKDAERCEDCGCELDGVDPVYDELGMMDTSREMESKAAEINEYLRFHKVEVESGYYSGLQFYVNSLYDGIEDFTNEESQDEFGLCRSVMLRKFKSEKNFITRQLRKARADLGLMEFVCTAHFSNGEAVYTRVDKPLSNTARVKIAAKATMAA